MFDATFIIYLYIAIIISTIAFSFGYKAYENHLNKIGKKRKEIYKDLITDQIQIIETGSRKKDQDHLKYFSKKLKNINNLLIFQDILNELKEENPRGIKKYLVRYSEFFQTLMMHYDKKETIYKAFYASFLTKNYPFDRCRNKYIDEKMILYSNDPSIYCRENAMLYLYQRASGPLIIRALKLMSQRNLYYNHKLLANDLLKFKGNKERFERLLLKNFPEFSSDVQIGVINYLRFSSHDLNKQFMKMLISEKYDKEVNLAIIRYFGRNIYVPILPELLKYLDSDDPEKLEYKIIVAQILSGYDVKEVRKKLIFCLRDVNWHVRKNAATSLSKMHLTKHNLEQIKQIDDRYANEIVKYVFKTTAEERKDKYVRVN